MMFEAKHFWTHYDVHSSSSSLLTSDEESACALNLFSTGGRETEIVTARAIYGCIWYYMDSVHVNKLRHYSILAAFIIVLKQ